MSAPLAGGTRSLVARVRTAYRADAVLKVNVPDDDLARRLDVLRAAEGRGHVIVLRADARRCAVLMEALGPTVDALGLSPQQQIAALCATLRVAWRPAPDTTRTQLRAKADSLARSVARMWEEQGRPCSAAVVDTALAYARRRAADPSEAAFVHGDPHPGNLLRVLAPRPGAESGYVSVDADGFVAPRSYDLGVGLRDWCAELLDGTPWRPRGSTAR